MFPCTTLIHSQRRKEVVVKKKPRFLKFRFHVPLVVPICQPATNIVNARKQMHDALKHGDVIVSPPELGSATMHKADPQSWKAELAWRCPDCEHEQWFPLSSKWETCFGHCRSCGKKFIVIQGYIKRDQGGCDACSERLACLTTPHAKPVYVSEDDLI